MGLRLWGWHILRRMSEQDGRRVWSRVEGQGLGVVCRDDGRVGFRAAPNKILKKPYRP